MYPTMINAIAIIFGGMIGLNISKILTDRYKEIIMQGLGVTIVVLGISMAIESKSSLLMLSTVVLGALIGEYWRVQEKFESVGEYIKGRLTKFNVSETFTEGFVNGIFFFSMGTLGIIGAIEYELNGDPSMFYAKTIIDGLLALVLSTTMGVGVVMSVVLMLSYQTGLCVLASLIAPVFNDAIIVELTAVGGVIVLAAGLGLLNIVNMRTSNLLPALLVIVAYAVLVKFFPALYIL